MSRMSPAFKVGRRRKERHALQEREKAQKKAMAKVKKNMGVKKG